MQKLITAIFLILCLHSYGQKGILRPFKLIILKPDTAIIDKSFYSEIGSVEMAHLKSYYQCHRGNEAFEKDFQSPKYWTQVELVIKNTSIIDLPDDIKQFKYFQTISEYSASIYDFYFNEYEPHSTIIELPNQHTGVNALRNLSDSTKADYIVFFENIHTVIKSGLPVLKLTTCLYSSKEKKIIFKKQTEGNTINMGAMTNPDMSNVMWTCNPNVRLSCLLVNGVRTSTQEISEILRNRQNEHQLRSKIIPVIRSVQ